MIRPLLITAGGLVAASCLSFGSSAPRGGEHETIELVETSPAETTLGHGDLRETHVVWREMIDGARTRIELAHFYASNRPGSRLEPVVVALEEAAKRGVRVRFLADAGFASTYPETLARLDAAGGIEVRRLDLGELTGGALHAKLMLVDGREAFLGSANFDWRSLEHIQELGVRIGSTSLAAQVATVFEHDWALAAGEIPPSLDLAVEPERVTFTRGDHATVRLVASSPDGLGVDESAWNLAAILRLLDGARDTAWVQLLSYDAVDRDGRPWPVIDDALRRAAARGVDVRLLLADWCKRAGTIDRLQALQRVPGIEIRLVTLPPSSTGFIPYARVVHAKHLIVDGRRAWLGTSNWSRDYFDVGRNLGVIVEGASFARRLERFFLDGWQSEYATTVDPDARYEPPRIAE